MSITLHSWVEWHLHEATSVRTLLVQTGAKLWSLVESYIFDWKLWIPFPLSVMSTSVVHDKRNKCLMLLSLSPNLFNSWRGSRAVCFSHSWAVLRLHTNCFINCLARWNNTANSCIPPIPPPPREHACTGMWHTHHSSISYLFMRCAVLAHELRLNCPVDAYNNNFMIDYWYSLLRNILYSQLRN